MSFKLALIKAAKNLFKNLPIILGTILSIALITVLIPPSFYSKIFTKHILSDSLIGGLIGSLSAGNPITSYILGGEFLDQGISLAAVTAFIVAWVTVGIIQLPAESVILGKKFAFLRNITSFILSIFAALITVLILNLF